MATTASGHEIDEQRAHGTEATASLKQLLKQGGEWVDNNEIALCPMDTCTLWRQVGKDSFQLVGSWKSPSRPTEETQTRSLK